MSHMMTAVAMRLPELDPVARIVLYWIADHHNESTGQCNPSVARLARLCELSPRRVVRHIAKLESAGLVRRHRQTRADGSTTTNHFTLHLDTPRPKSTPPQNVQDDCGDGGVTDDHPPLSPVTPPPVTGDTPPCHRRHPPLSPVTPLEPLIEPLREQKPPYIPPKGGIRFDAFWQCWPVHFRKARRKEALKHWTSHRLDEVADDVMRSLGEWKASSQWSDDQFIPAPIVWLRREPWKAPPPPAKATKPDDDAPAWDWMENGTSPEAYERLLADARERGLIHA